MTAANCPAPARAGHRDGDPLLEAFRRLCHQIERPISEQELRALVPLGSDPLDRRRLGQLASRLGYRMKRSALGRRQLERLPTPSIIVSADFGEVGLLRARSGPQWILVDPLDGTPSAETDFTLKHRFVYAFIFVRMAEHASGKTLWAGLIRPRLRPALLQIGVASVVVNLLALATPLFLMTVYNKVISQGALATLDVLFIGMLTLLFFDWALRVLRGYATAHTGARLQAAVGNEVVHRLLHQPYRVFESMATGATLERVHQLDALRALFSGQLPLLAVDMLFVALFLGALALIAPDLALLAALAMPVFLGVSYWFHRRQRGLADAGFNAHADKTSSLSEALHHALSVKALGLEPDMEHRYERRLAKAASSEYQIGRANAFGAAAGHVLQQGVVLLIVYAGARSIVAGDMTIGALIAATILSARALAPMRQAVAVAHQVIAARNALRGVQAMLAEPIEAGGHLAPGAKRLRGRISFEHVSYRYQDGSELALDDVDLEIRPGAIVAVIGAPGSGKSTLAKLILGLITPEKGRVMIDGLDVRHLPPAWLRRQAGMVPQEIQLLSGTIAENIAIGERAPAIERIIAAARFAGIHEQIERLPQGYQTRLGERGVGLSAGQRQQIAIARTLMRNPRILLLDEATSALDQQTETVLLANLRRASRGRTIIMVTHRLSAAASIAERVVCLEQGRVARTGPVADVIDLTRERASAQDAGGFRPAVAAAGG
ncbi:MAG: peptidase domain-containing ABC transporter [Geminicoccaceae bacterium]